jgi:hypothetical protein
LVKNSVGFLTFLQYVLFGTMLFRSTVGLAAAAAAAAAAARRLPWPMSWLLALPLADGKHRSRCCCCCCG